MSRYAAIQLIDLVERQAGKSIQSLTIRARELGFEAVADEFSIDLDLFCDAVLAARWFN